MPEVTIAVSDTVPLGTVVCNSNCDACIGRFKCWTGTDVLWSEWWKPKIAALISPSEGCEDSGCSFEFILACDFLVSGNNDYLSFFAIAKQSNALNEMPGHRQNSLRDCLTTGSCEYLDIS